MTPAVQDKVGDFSKKILGEPRLLSDFQHLEGHVGYFVGKEDCCAEQANSNERQGTGRAKQRGKKMFSELENKEIKAASDMA